jgi:hypothetical protein
MKTKNAFNVSVCGGSSYDLKINTKSILVKKSVTLMLNISAEHNNLFV